MQEVSEKEAKWNVRVSMMGKYHWDPEDTTPGNSCLIGVAVPNAFYVSSLMWDSQRPKQKSDYHSKVESILPSIQWARGWMEIEQIVNTPS